jgi:hypothetical protein
MKPKPAKGRSQADAVTAAAEIISLYRLVAIVARTTLKALNLPLSDESTLRVALGRKGDRRKRGA